MRRAIWLLFVLFYLDAPPAFSQTSASAGPQITASLSPEGERSLTDANLFFLKQKKSAMEWGRDPFVLPAQPAGTTEGAPPGTFSLSAIIYNNGRGAAIINSGIVRKGDRVEGMAVEEIYPDRVVLSEGSRILELKVDPFLSGK